jgi:hypothetical protein
LLKTILGEKTYIKEVLHESERKEVLMGIAGSKTYNPQS